MIYPHGIKGGVSDVVEFVEEILAVVLGDLDVGGGVERGKKHAFPGCDH